MQVLVPTRFASAACAALLALASPAPAQCPVPDFLDGGPCCAATQTNRPVVPDFGQDALSICWLDCDPEAIFDARALWSDTATTFPGGPCTNFSKRLRLWNPAGVLMWRGRLKFVYSRTWLERDTVTGNDYQVWRYLVNGDMKPGPATTAVPCPRPPCLASTGNRAKFSGYVDYVEVCGSGMREYAWMVTHACDAIDHQPGFVRGGVFHPDRSYTFVGPGSTFSVSNAGPVESGSTGSEAVRRVPFAAGGVSGCEYEQQVQSTLSPQLQYCFCGPVAGSPQFHQANLVASTPCGTSVTTPGGPFLPGYLSMGIGSWTDPLTYPGVERLRWNAGNYDWGDPCATTSRNELFFGVTTQGGYFAVTIPSNGTPGAPLPPTFVDQGSAWRNVSSGNPGVNIPYKTDHLLNLNYP